MRTTWQESPDAPSTVPRALFPFRDTLRRPDGPPDPFARYAQQASGDVSAFVSIATSKTGVFAETELDALMNNPAVKTINGSSKGFFQHWFGGLIS